MLSTFLIFQIINSTKSMLQEFCLDMVNAEAGSVSHSLFLISLFQSVATAFVVHCVINYALKFFYSLIVVVSLWFDQPYSFMIWIFLYTYK